MCGRAGADRDQDQEYEQAQGAAPLTVREELQLFVRGALNYYNLGMTYAEARELEDGSAGECDSTTENSGDVPALEDAI